MDNDWYLDKLIISNQEYPCPQNDEIPFIQADFSFSDLIDFNTGACGDWLYASLTLNYEGDPNSEFITWSQGDQWEEGNIECTDADNQDYKQFYYSFYNVYNNQEIFSFTILNETNDTKTLIITNQHGNQAIYNNQKLSVDNFVFEEISVYPNPVKNKLTIENSQFSITDIIIYNSEGTIILESKVNSSKYEIDFSSFVKDIYYISILSNDRIVQTEKIIKI